MILPSRRRIMAAALLAPAGVRAQQPPQAASPLSKPILIEARAADIRLRAEPKPLTAALTYNGASPGPTFRVKQGEQAVIRLTNKLQEETSIHWYGMNIGNKADGVAGLTEAALPAGASRDVTFAARDAGAYLYQPCVPGRTADQIERGLYGALIVEERQPPEADLDVAVVIDDWRLDDQSAYVPAGASQPGDLPRLGNVLTVNGSAKAAEATVPTGGRARLRLFNACGARILTIRFAGVPATIVAMDGQPSSSAFQPKGAGAIMTPGGRIELMIDLPGEPGQQFSVLAELFRSARDLEKRWAAPRRAAADRAAAAESPARQT